MGEYKPTTFQEYLARMPENRRLKLEERWKVLRAEEAFWDSLPETERNKRLEAPKVSYDTATDTLWLKNGRPMPRHYNIVKGRVTAYFEAEIWYPSAVKVSGAYELLAGFFRLGDGLVSRWPTIEYGEDGVLEKVLHMENLEINYTIINDSLWINNGKPGFGHKEFAEDLSVCFTEDYQIPIGVLLTPASELLTPIFAQAAASKASRLV